MKFTKDDLQQQFEDYCKAKKLISTRAPRPANALEPESKVKLYWADSRCGNLVSIAKEDKNGCISPLIEFMKPKEMRAFLLGQLTTLNY